MRPSWTREEFYRLRDLRTNAVVRGFTRGDVPVHVAIGKSSVTSPIGQLLLFALTNQLARAHRNITFDLPGGDHPVLTKTRFPGSNVSETVISIARMIDPYGSFKLGSEQLPGAVSIGIGMGVPTDLDWYVGACGFKGLLDHSPTELVIQSPNVAYGAALASCLGACAVFRVVNGLPTIPRSLSVWTYHENEIHSSEQPDVKPVDVGRVLVVGAGAVASAMVYWLDVLGVAGAWAVVDRDIVKLHNTNRSPVFLPEHAGWGAGEPAAKARLLADMLPQSSYEVAWFHEAKIAQAPFDVILALANEHEVRSSIASLSAPVTLYATTGEAWTTQLHRHVAGTDDCIHCRMVEVTPRRFQCSDGAVPTTEAEPEGDAALPFLSAASGLMLVSALQRLAAGVLVDGAVNDWRWYWDSQHLMSSAGVRSCRADCRQLQPAHIRRAMHKNNRWIALDRG